MAPDEQVENLTSALAALDARAFKLAAACKDLVSGSPIRARIARIDARIDARIGNVERSFEERYAAELAFPGWHGATSCHRMAWQDSEVLELVADPAALRALLLRFQRGQERGLGRFTLGSALISGLAINRPSYLFSACPNWAAVPAISDQWTNLLDDMKPPRTARQEKPFLVGGAMLAAAGAALDAMEELVGRNNGAGGHRRECWAAIGAAGEAPLLDTLRAFLSPARVEMLIWNPDVPSTAIGRMRGQCLEVMRMLSGVLAATANDLERALGFGLVSHALDAKHLVAMIDQESPHGVSLPKDIDREGREVFNSLLDELRDHRMGERARSLIAARLRQALQLVADHAEMLGVPLANLERRLAHIPANVHAPTGLT